MDRNHELVIAYAQTMFKRDTEKPTFNEADVENNLLKFHGYYTAALSYFHYIDTSRKA